MAADEPLARYRVGVDENGLGPRLGPMVVTAVLARVTGEGARTAGSAPRGALARRLGDSKQMVAHGDVALGEAWARALVARGCGRDQQGERAPAGDERAPAGDERAGEHAPGSIDALVHAISVDDRAALRSLCPGHVEAQCWSPEGESFSASDKLLRSISGDLDRLADKGVEIVAVRSVLLCAKRLNDGLRAGKNRFVLDLHAMERLVLELRGLAGSDVLAVCGKVGGFGKYGAAFGPLAGRLHTVVEEGRARSAYRFPGLGELAFVRDGDASDLCVAMASMVGKYLREVLMGRIARHYQRAIDGLTGASGYHDPVTARFVAATRLVRGSREVPDDCFERRSADGEAPLVAGDARPADGSPAAAS